MKKHSFVTPKILKGRDPILQLLFIWNNINHAPDNQFMKQIYYCTSLFLAKIYVESTNTGKNGIDQKTSQNNN